MSPAPLVGSPPARPTCSYPACQSMRCMGCQQDTTSIPPPVPPQLPPPVYVQPPPPQQQQPVQPLIQSISIEKPAGYKHTLQPVMDEVNANSIAWWKSWIAKGPIFVLIFIAYYWLIKYVDGSWDPFAKTTNTVQSRSVSGNDSSITIHDSRLSSTTNNKPTNTSYTYQVDHDRKTISIGSHNLTTEARAEIAALELNGYRVESNRSVINNRSNNDLSALLREIKQYATALRVDWNRTYASRFYNDERKGLSDRLDAINSKIDQAIGITSSSVKE